MTATGSKYRGTKEYHRVFSKLIDAADHSASISYKEVAGILGITQPGYHMAREVGQVLGEISEDEHRNGRPMLSALAVAEDGLPGGGFYDLARRLGKLASADPGQEIPFWEEEQQRVYEAWQPK